MPSMTGKTLVIALLLTSVGCAATQEQLIRRASFDLQCPAANLKIYQIDKRSRGVTGCGQKAVYVESCAGPNNNLDCTWVLNSPK